MSIMSLYKLSTFVFVFTVFFSPSNVNCEDCGQTGTEKKILNGESPMNGEWPWMVAITRETSGKYVAWCSGFLIDQIHVLTAAHCVNDKDEQYSTRIGKVNQDEGETYTIGSIAVHEGYKLGKFYDDIAVLTLTREVDIPNFNPVCLPDAGLSRKNLTGYGTTLVGWGRDGQRGPMNNFLQQLSSVPVTSNQECKRIYKELIPTSFRRQFPRGINGGFICAGFPDRNGKSCQFLSGAPLMYQERSRWFVVGLVSFGYSCGNRSDISGYIRVSKYLDWIREKTTGCGKRGIGEGSDLVGKSPTDGEWPWMVAITQRDKPDRNYSTWCTGFLIDRRHVLSAAHCFHNRKKEQFSTRIGKVNLDEGETYPIDRITVHEGYTTDIFYDDIAVLTLTREVDAPNFNPVCLPDAELSRKDLTDFSTTIVGWGADKPYGPPSNHLQQLSRLRVMSNEECSELYKKFLSNHERIFPGGFNGEFLCSGELDACRFLSGSPLMFRERERWFAVGITSFGYGCGRPDVPGGYIRVSSFLNWIGENTKD